MVTSSSQEFIKSKIAIVIIFQKVYFSTVHSINAELEGYINKTQLMGVEFLFRSSIANLIAHLSILQTDEK